MSEGTEGHPGFEGRSPRSAKGNATGSNPVESMKFDFVFRFFVKLPHQTGGYFFKNVTLRLLFPLYPCMIRAAAPEGRPGGGFTDYFVIPAEMMFPVDLFNAAGRFNQEVIYDLE